MEGNELKHESIESEANLTSDLNKDEKEEELENLNKQLNTIKNELNNVKIGQEKETQRYKDLEIRISKLSREISDRDKTITDKDTYINDLQKQKYKLTEALKGLTGKRKIQVQILWKEDGEVTSTIAKALIHALNTHRNGVNLSTISCMKATEIQAGIPLLLLCFASNDTFQGISSALKGITVSDKTAVIVVHRKKESVLPLEPSEQVLTRKEFALLGGVFDIAFTTDDGLYSCEMNEMNVAKIIEFTNRFGTQI